MPQAFQLPTAERDARETGRVEMQFRHQIDKISAGLQGATQAAPERARSSSMNMAEWEIKQLQSDIEQDPRDPFLRCSLACQLAAQGDYQRALMHLGAAMDVADGSVAAGCVVAAVRQVTDEFARLWQLPGGRTHLELISA